VILTPHEGFYTSEALTRIATVTMENLSFYEQVRHTAQRPIPWPEVYVL
jgi:phosphoglycerate dehydrogenase-like enzyme